LSPLVEIKNGTKCGWSNLRNLSIYRGLSAQIHESVLLSLKPMKRGPSVGRTFKLNFKVLGFIEQRIKLTTS
jgi:hypothetical protein